MPEAESVDGTRIYYEVHGSGPPLVFCHAWTQDHRSFNSQCSHFAPRYRVVSWDARGHGRSQWSRFWQRYSVELLAQDLVAVMDAAGTERAVLVGHSMGGITALKCCELFPARVAGLVLVNSTYRNPVEASSLPNGLSPWLRALARITALPLGLAKPAGWLPRRLTARYLGRAWVTRRLVRRLVFGNYLSSAPPADDAELERVARNILGMPLHESMLALEAMLHFDVSELLRRIEVPTLVFAADNDWIISRWSAQQMQALIPDCELEVFHGSGGHLAHLSSPTRFNQRLQRFLDGIDD